MISGDAAAVDCLVSGGEGQTVISQYPQVTPPEAGVPAAQSVPEVWPLTFISVCLLIFAKYVSRLMEGKSMIPHIGHCPLSLPASYITHLDLV